MPRLRSTSPTCSSGASVRVDLYTDAGVKDGVATWATVAVVEGRDPVEHSGRLRDETGCSSTAELRAIANALHRMLATKMIGRGDEVRLYTDSYHAVHRLKGFYRKRPGSSMAKATLVILKIAEVHGIMLSPHHIPSHKPDSFSRHAPFNNRCDKLCRKARGEPPPVKVTPARKAHVRARALAGKP